MITLWDDLQSLFDSGQISPETLDKARRVQGVTTTTGQPDPNISGGPTTSEPGLAPSDALSVQTTTGDEPLPPPAEGPVAIEEPQIPSPSTLRNAVKQVESGGDPTAVSPRGAKGAYQFLDSTAMDYVDQLGIKNYDPTNEQQQALIFDAHMGRLLQKYNGDEALALAAYNAGEGNIDKALSLAPAKNWDGVAQVLPQVTGERSVETLKYVPAVLSLRGDAGAAAPGVPTPQIQAEPQGAADMLAEGMQNRENAAIGTVELAQEKARTEAAYLDESIKQQNAIIARNQELESTRRRVIDKYAADIEKSIDEYASTDIDSGRWWSKQSTGEKIMTVVSTVLLGALNPALGVSYITRLSNQDLAEQRAKRERLGKVIDAKMSLYDDMRSRFNDDLTAETASQNAIFRGIELRVKRDMTKFAGPEAAVRAEELLGGLKQEQARVFGEWEKSTDSRLKPILESQQRAAQRQMALTGKLDPTMLSEDDRKRAIFQGNQLLGFAADDTDARAVREQLGAAEMMTRGIDKLASMRSEEGGAYFDTTPRAAYKPLVSDLKIAVKDLARLGALSGPDFKLLDDMIPTEEQMVKFYAGNRLFREDPIQIQLRALKEQINEKVQSALRNKLIQRSSSPVTSDEVRSALTPGRAR